MFYGSSNQLNSILVKKPKRNLFDLSRVHTTSMNMGDLVPFYLQETLPGETYSITSDNVTRFAPMVNPVLHPIKVYTHYYFVPNRILMHEGLWEKFLARNDNAVAPTVTYTAGDYNNFRYIDYCGLPKLTNPNTLKVNAFPFAAIQCVYNEYYRDQNVIAEQPYKLSFGDNSAYVPDVTPGKNYLFQSRKRAWSHDYFTSALPEAQKGPVIDIPIGEGIVKLRDDVLNLPGRIRNADDHSLTGGALAGDGVGRMTAANATDPNDAVVYDPNNTLSVEMEPVSITDLRRATKLQEFAELCMRAGTRLKEFVWAMFGVDVGDGRLQRPEYVTGTATPVIISEVLNTTGAPDGPPQGDMAGHGIAVTDVNNGRIYVREHGWIVGIASVLPEPMYMQGAERHWFREDIFDYFFTQFAHIGEQPVYNKELYADTDTATQNEPFAYQRRYAEYTIGRNMASGDMKTTLKTWHLGREFEGLPGYNQSFIECDPTKRIFAVPGDDENPLDHLYVSFRSRVIASRPVPKYGDPRFV